MLLFLSNNLFNCSMELIDMCVYFSCINCMCIACGVSTGALASEAESFAEPFASASNVVCMSFSSHYVHNIPRYHQIVVFPYLNN